MTLEEVTKRAEAALGRVGVELIRFDGTRVTSPKELAPGTRLLWRDAADPAEGPGASDSTGGDNNSGPAAAVVQAAMEALEIGDASRTLTPRVENASAPRAPSPAASPAKKTSPAKTAAALLNVSGKLPVRPAESPQGALPPTPKGIDGQTEEASAPTPPPSAPTPPPSAPTPPPSAPTPPPSTPSGTDYLLYVASILDAKLDADSMRILAACKSLPVPAYAVCKAANFILGLPPPSKKKGSNSGWKGFKSFKALARNPGGFAEAARAVDIEAFRADAGKMETLEVILKPLTDMHGDEAARVEACRENSLAAAALCEWVDAVRGGARADIAKVTPQPIKGIMPGFQSA
jgi:hypothetical protein